MSLVRPVAAFRLRGDAAASFTKDTEIDWGTDGVETIAKIVVGPRTMIAVVRLKPRLLEAGSTYEVQVGDCSGQLSVRPL